MKKLAVLVVALLSGGVAAYLYAKHKENKTYKSCDNCVGWDVFDEDDDLYVDNIVVKDKFENVNESSCSCKCAKTDGNCGDTCKCGKSEESKDDTSL